MSKDSQLPMKSVQQFHRDVSSIKSVESSTVVALYRRTEVFLYKTQTHLVESGWKNRDCDQIKFTKKVFFRDFYNKILHRVANVTK